jgi:hypothetical protein
MESLWQASLARRYGVVLDQIERAMRECPGELWEASLWEVKREHPNVWPARRVDAKGNGDETLLQVHSAFWNIAYHTLFHVDFYLSGGVLKGFKPQAPFREVEHRANVVPARTYTRAELQRYVDYNRKKVRATIPPLTHVQAQRLVPRFGVPFGEFLIRTLMHTQEHAAQLNLFLGQHDVEPRGGAGAEFGRAYLREGVRGRDDAGIDAFVQSIGGYARLLPLVLAGFAKNLSPSDSCVVRFEVGPHVGVISAKPGRANFEKRAPKSVDATLRVGPQEFLRWMTADVDFAEATADGRIVVDGDVAALRRLFETVQRPG